MKPLKIIEIFTDGACSGNPGPGGWAAILRYKGHELILCSGELHTTNNRMELAAVIESIKTLKERCKIRIYTDSQYVSNGINFGWAAKWKSNGWKKSDNKSALNADMWSILLDTIILHEYEVIWLNGHAGHIENERCDDLAVKMARIYSNLLV